MRIIFATLASILALTAVPAHADITAHYSTRSPTNAAEQSPAMAFEINDDGRIRFASDMPEGYMLYDGNVWYEVRTGADGTPFAVNTGITGAPPATPIDPASATNTDGITLQLVTAGATSANGFQGTGYRIVITCNADALPAPMRTACAEQATESRRTDRAADAVFSTDPALAPLGRAMATFWRYLVEKEQLGETLVPQFAALSGAGHATIKAADITLASVSHDAIDDARFALPARVLTREEAEALRPQ